MSLSNVKLHLIDSLDEVLKFYDWLGSRDAELIGLDTESTGLERDARIRLVQIGGREHGWAIPWDGWWGVAKDALDRYKGSIVTHNGPFDLPKLTRQGLNIARERVRDTMAMARVVEPHMSMALKNQTARHVDSAAAYAQGELGKAIGDHGAFTWANVPITFGPYWQYGALDPVLTVHLHDVHWPTVQRECAAAYDLEVAVFWVLERMENYGAHIDRAHVQHYYSQFMAYVEQAEKWIISEYGVKPGSNAAIIERLQRDGFQFDKRTASGALALDKDVLAHCLDHPLAKTVLQRRQLQKLSKTYLLNFMQGVDEMDCIHPQINSLGTRTGRMSMQDPNLQNLPRKSESNPAALTIRNSITTRYEDGALLMCDFDQIEMRGMAFMSGDPGLTTAFLSGDDFFVALAQQMFDDPTITKKDPRRQITKNAGYATIYSAGIAKFAQTAGIPYQRAVEVRQRWDTLYPGTRAYERRIIAEAQANFAETDVPFIRSPFDNRKLVAENINKAYALVNYSIQQTAATVFKSKLLSLAATGLLEFMVIPVHDEIILDVPREHLRDAVETLNTVMNDSETFAPIPITASVSFGKRWGEKRDLGDISELCV